MRKRNAVKKSRAGRREKTGLLAFVWSALTLTGQLVAHIKNVQLGYLRVGAGLAKVRDSKIYEVLKHPDLEDYAEKRLGLSKASLYRYLKIYSWVAKNKPEWLLPKPKGRIPDLTDISDAIRIEDTLKESPRMTQAKRKGLEELKNRALDGNLSQGEADRAIRKGSRASNALMTFASQIRSLRRKGARINGMPPEVLSHLDSAVTILTTEQQVAKAGLHLLSLPVETTTAALA